ncbi:hypothetical protein [Mycolicibacterium vaccae]|uniref:Integral membrane protein n=1 Tax=Mycolicibacterium vaccae ATCC 25954 TaxID=1194972 RepID=K0UG95_MYCVA|nr:hypothetical protein [Mycolicibacterium vaccae]ANI40170.1 membrane protein [Mycolicibacterium vaccae 95051]EJZ06302.1 integral membrane protein [Mycolicibacterium vaccae ATCC 25954]MCV7063308.1 hypothetical protein [Mycolicibacterium vaccae]
MGRHHAPEPAGIRNRPAVRTTVLALTALTVFVLAMIASYAGAFAKPTLHHLTVAVAAPAPILDELRSQNALSVNEVGDAVAARTQVSERAADAALAVDTDGHLTVYVAGGGGRSVAAAAEGVGRAAAERAGLTAVIDDVAPTTPGNPSGTVEFYAVIFVSIGASAGAALLGRLMGVVGTPAALALRTMSLTAFSAVLAGAVTVYVGPVLGALTGHPWEVFGALWLYAMAVGGAITGIAAAFGVVASIVLGLFLVIVGNAAAAGPVGRPLLSGFYSTLTGVVPQGSGVSLLRSICYFGGHGATTPLVTLGIWAAVGGLFATLATAARVNYRALHDRLAGPRGAVLRSRLVPSAD